ncbi:MAG: hypothetical protein NUV53_05320 [Patescibacteria group bacterium]|nr:hypothetical protein [Patescibacteria group bacterium]
MQTRGVLTTVSICLVLFLCILLFSENPLLLFCIFAGGSIALLALDTREWRLFTLAIITALIVEPFVVRSGVWTYKIGFDFLGVPLWIFLVWGVVAVSFYRVGRGLRSAS